ncbi:MAG: histidinol-phosphate transaminase [Nakamurella sp.]
MSQVQLRNDLDELPAYLAGKPALMGSDQRSFKLSANELPWPVDPAVTDAIMAAASGLNRYPDQIGARLVSRLATELSVAADRIVVGGGSISLVQLLLQTVADPGDAVVYAWRSYEAYPIVISTSRARPVPVPLRDHRHDLPSMVEAVRRTHARIVIVCSPNNPTGAAVTAAELDEFIAAVPTDCLIVLDEAYIEFDSAVGRPEGIALARRHANVAVLRTFSKAHGLAGLRVGYCVAPSRITAALRQVTLPFTVSAVAEAAAITALDVWARQRERVVEIIARRDRFADGLRRMGFDIPDSYGNFVWLPLGEASASLDDALRASGISVRTFPGDGVRITIGEPDAMDAVLAVARGWR